MRRRNILDENGNYEKDGYLANNNDPTGKKIAKTATEWCKSKTGICSIDNKINNFNPYTKNSSAAPS